VVDGQRWGFICYHVVPAGGHKQHITSLLHNTARWAADSLTKAKNAQKVAARHMLHHHNQCPTAWLALGLGGSRDAGHKLNAKQPRQLEGVDTTWRPCRSRTDEAHQIHSCLHWMHKAPPDAAQVCSYSAAVATSELKSLQKSHAPAIPQASALHEDA
jgi:hypothetical protein